MQVKTLCDFVACKKWNKLTPKLSLNKLEECGTCQKQLQASGTKKSLLLCGLPKTLIDIKWFWIVK